MEIPKAAALRLELFGTVVEIAPAVHLPYLRFLLRPHVVEHSGTSPRLFAEFAPSSSGTRRDGAVERAGTPARPQLLRGSAPDITPTDILVRGDDLALVSCRAFRGWGNVPPQMPPFAAWPDLLAVLPAVVLASGDRAVALIGSPDSAKAEVAVALARRGWRFVSGSLLVIDRAHGWVLPYHAPLEARGAAAAALREARPPPEMCQASISPVSGEVLQVRPEALGPIVPIRARPPRPALVRLCQGADDRVRLELWPFRPSVWPAAAGAELAELPRYRLSVPGAAGAEDAATLIERMPAEHQQPVKADECRVV